MILDSGLTFLSHPVYHIRVADVVSTCTCSLTSAPNVLYCGVYVVVPGDSYTDELPEMPVDKSSLLLLMQQSDSVTVHGRPPQFIQRPPLEVNVTEADPLTLRCIVEGHPKPIGVQ